MIKLKQLGRTVSITLSGTIADGSPVGTAANVVDNVRVLILNPQNTYSLILPDPTVSTTRFSISVLNIGQTITINGIKIISDKEITFTWDGYDWYDSKLIPEQPILNATRKFLSGNMTWNEPPTFVGATDSANGQIGSVPVPFIADRNALLRGNGNWFTPAIVKAKKTSAQQITTSGVVITNWTEEIDNLSTFNNTTGIFTAPVDGYYQVSAQLRCVTTGSGGFDYRIQVLKNGSLYEQAYFQLNVGLLGSEQPILQLTPTIVPCNTSDTISIRAYTQSNLNLNASGNDNFLSIYQIG